MNILIVIPAFNEERFIGKIIDDLRKHGYKNILVVNDGSKDQTELIARNKKVRVVTHVVNRGLGAAISTGLAFARETGPDVVVTFDADGQHLASDIPKLISPIDNNRADVVIGSRLKNNLRGFPKRRLIPILVSNMATFLLYGLYSSDTTSGLRAFNKKAYDNIFLKADRMEFSNELFKEFTGKKLRYCEVPIKPIYTEYSMIGSKQGNELIASLKLGLKLTIDLLR